MERYTSHINIIKNLIQTRTILDFNTDWKYTDQLFASVPSDDNIDDSDWQSITLPHDYSIEHGFSENNPSGASGGYVKTGVLWYKKKFILSEEYSCKKIFLFFDGISSNSEIWLNGVMVKLHPYAYTPTHIDITPFVHFGNKMNCIFIKADTSLQPFSRFYQGTGIFRTVQLVITSHIHFDDFGVSYEFNSENNILNVDSNIRVAQFPETVWHDFGSEKNYKVAKRCSVKVFLYNQTGTYVTSNDGIEREVVEFTKHNNFKNSFTIPSPMLWSDKTPSMYYMRIALYVNDMLEDDVVVPVGLRTISYNAQEGLKINNKNIKLKGVCLHQDCGMFGCAVPVEEWIRRICMLKEMGANAIRTSHHPFPQEFYDICDLYGMYVMDEAFDEWTKGWSRDQSEMSYGKNLYGYYLYFDQWAETDVKLMVKRDRNHPSVIMWSMGNEIPDYYYQEGVDTLKKLVGFAKKEDRTRPVTIGAEGNYRLSIYEGIMDSLDIAGYNYVNLKHPDYYTEIHEKHPQWTFVSSETFYEPAHWVYIQQNRHAIGQFLWAGFDYLGESCFSNPINDLSLDFSNVQEESDPNFGGMGSKAVSDKLYHGWIAGIIDFIGNPKAHYYYYQSLWQEKPVIHVCSKMYNWHQNGEWWKLIPGADIWNFVEGEERTIFVFTNCHSVKVYLNGKFVTESTRKEGDIYPFEFKIPYSAGELCAKGFDKNLKELVAHSIFTTRNPCRVQLTHDFDPSNKTQKWVNINLSVVDNNGRTVVTDKRNLEITVKGAELYRLGNASMYNRESYKTNRSTFFNGQALAILRCNQNNDKIQVVVRADELEEQTWTLTGGTV